MEQTVNQEVSKLDMLVSQLANLGKSEYRGGVHAITARLPTHQMALLQACAEHSGMSVNKIIVEVLEVGLDLAFRELPKKDSRAIAKLQGAFADKLMASDQSEQSGVL